MPVKAFAQQAIEGTKTRWVLRVATPGSVVDEFGLATLTVMVG